MFPCSRKPCNSLKSANGGSKGGSILKIPHNSLCHARKAALKVYVNLKGSFAFYKRVANGALLTIDRQKRSML